MPHLKEGNEILFPGMRNGTCAQGGEESWGHFWRLPTIVCLLMTNIYVGLTSQGTPKSHFCSCIFMEAGISQVSFSLTCCAATNRVPVWSGFWFSFPTGSSALPMSSQDLSPPLCDFSTRAGRHII